MPSTEDAYACAIVIAVLRLRLRLSLFSIEQYSLKCATRDFEFWILCRLTEGNQRMWCLKLNILKDGFGVFGDEASHAAYARRRRGRRWRRRSLASAFQFLFSLFFSLSISRSLFEIGSFLDHSKQIILVNARERRALMKMTYINKR